MRFRMLVLSLTLALLAAPLAARAQHAGRAYRIGVLDVADVAANAANLDAFRRGLGERGYVEGQHFVIEYCSADGRAERFPDLAAELVRLGVDLIITRGYPATLAARQNTRTIPIVMAGSGDPAAGSGVLVSLAGPGGNVTGLSTSAPPELGGKRLQLLRDVVPGLSRVGVLWASGDLHPLLTMRETEKIARALGIELVSLELRRPENLAQAFETALLGRPIDAVIVVEDYITVTHRTEIVDFVARSRLPAIYGLRDFVDAGGLIAYGTDRRALFHRSAGYVDRILRGTKPGDLPVEPPATFELVINLKTAKALGLTIPPSVLARADEVIQ